MTQLDFEDFILTVSPDLTQFITQLHNTLTHGGCKIEIKEAKSGYVVSYLMNKKTIANYVQRKAGTFVRIYANNVTSYMELLDTFPQEMKNTIIASPICKRLFNPNDCNAKCAMGYDFIMQGERHQKCRNNAFMFLLCNENNPFIEAMLSQELKARANT